MGKWYNHKETLAYKTFGKTYSELTKEERRRYMQIRQHYRREKMGGKNQKQKGVRE